jgi:hypothetical protein
VGEYVVDRIQADLGQVVPIPAPAAGAGFSYKYGRNEFWKPRVVCFQLVTSATVASRIVYLDVIDGGGLKIGRFSSGYTQTASLTSVYTFGINMNEYGANAAASIGAPIPELWLHPGAKLSVGVTAIDTTDQLSAINLTLDQVFAGSYPDS